MSRDIQSTTTVRFPDNQFPFFRERESFLLARSTIPKSCDNDFPVTTTFAQGARRRDGRVAASNAPRKCPGGKGWIGGGAQAPSSSYRRLDARAEGEKRTSLLVVVEVPVGVERECEYVRVCIAVCFCECISTKRQKFTGTLKRHRDTENNHDDDYDHDNENVDKRDGQQRAISILAVAADSPGFSEKSGARGCTGVQEAARGTGGPAGACDQDATEEVRAEW
ncbi:hypothetical protein X777_13996 [Ooceraea biroi]|uniref:Uncharacterized protein n=1 Tax=Ooceraea biroi TaxID=2015173 RepID=A0A026WYC6_OOCBI|nr:hypothetical protein X777_13996 [Ooceraea biroi]